MAIERTFSIVKPDAVERDLIGTILGRLEAAGLKIVAARMIHMTKEQAEGFYAEHKGRPFFDDLVAYMISGPVVVQVLEGDNAIVKYRQILGATNPSEASAGTIRHDYAVSMSSNSAHGSDAPASAAREIAYFFDENEVFSR